MSEEVTKVTSEKPKDPKRVAQGKRLAQISKEAKERKMRSRIEQEGGGGHGYGLTTYATSAALVLTIGYIDKFTKATTPERAPVVQVQQHQAPQQWHEREPPTTAAVVGLQNDLLETLG